MSLLSFRNVAGGWLLALSAAASAAAAPNAELAAVLQKLSETASAQQASQIKDAIAASPLLSAQLGELAAAGKVTAIQVVPPEAIAPVHGARFSAVLNGTKIMLATALLPELLKNRLYDVIGEDDALPNNTTFVISHLAFHAQTRESMARFDDEIHKKIEAISKGPAPHDYTDVLMQGQNAQLGNEAAAFIQGWNHMIDAATQANGGKRLSVDQVSSLMTNLRYRFVFSKALQLPQGGMEVSNTGMILMNQRNIQAVATALKSSALADIE